MEIFSNTSYQKNVVFSDIKIYPTKIRRNNRITSVSRVRLTVHHDFYKYDYPFDLPSFFRKGLKHYDLNIWLEFMMAICTTEIQKKFEFKEFLTQQKIDNQQKTDLKKN